MRREGGRTHVTSALDQKNDLCSICNTLCSPSKTTQMCIYICILQLECIFSHCSSNVSIGVSSKIRLVN